MINGMSPTADPIGTQPQSMASAKALGKPSEVDNCK